MDEQRKENEMLWAAINRSTLRQAGCDNNGNHRPDTFPREAEGRGFTNHGGRSAGAGVWEWRADFLVIRGKCFQHIWKNNKPVRQIVEAWLDGAASRLLTISTQYTFGRETLRDYLVLHWLDCTTHMCTRVGAVIKLVSPRTHCRCGLDLTSHLYICMRQSSECYNVRAVFW